MNNEKELIKILAETAYKPKIENKFKNDEIFNNLNLFKIYLFLSFIWDMIIIPYSNLNSEFRKPIIKLKILIENKYYLLIKTNNFNENIFNDNDIKNTLIEIENLREKTIINFQKFKKNKFLKIEILELNYQTFKNFIDNENKYKLGTVFNGYCLLIEEIPNIILKTNILRTKLIKKWVSLIKDFILFALSIISLYLAIMALI